MTSKEICICFENAHADYHKQLDTEKKKQEKFLTKVIKHLGDTKNLQNLMLAIDCFQESQAYCNKYVEDRHG